MSEPGLTADYIEKAYSRFVPWEYFRLMGRKSIAEVSHDDVLEKKMTVLFSDIRNFTTLSEAMTPRENFRFLNDYFEVMEAVITVYGGIIDKYIGDAIMAIFPADTEDALQAGVNMFRQLDAFNERRKGEGRDSIGTGIGLNTGLMLLGTVGGKNRLSSTVISDAVNLASRIESMTKTYGVNLLVSEHTYYSLADPAIHDIRFADRVRVRGKEQPQSIYEVFDADPPEVLEGKRATRELFEEALACYHFKEVSRAEELLEKCLAECPRDKLAQLYRERCRAFMSTGIHAGTGEIDLSISWTPEITIGDARIDNQHRRLFSAANEFVESIRTGSNFAQIESMTAFLDEYVHVHFESEERCMAENDYPFLDMQKEQHERFGHYFAALKGQVRDDLANRRQMLLFKVQVFVIDWLIHHTSKLDMHFARFLKKRGNGP